MADFLIKHLKKKAEEHSALEMLVNQWGFDEKLIPKALQTVGNLFPHYSRHDESHSKQILINIERLLGEDNIARLTAADTWLLLEAAYWHDIGMVVPHKDIQDAFSQTDFQHYVDEIRNNPHHGLHRFCLSFKLNNMSQCFGGADTPLEAVDKFRELMAEWFRRQHASRAGKIVEDPWTSAGISSPRTELIPTRLFKLLGHICKMHGLPFKDLLAPMSLLFREDGLMMGDNCHPRFVACLLRLGDLLDLDDNRFCPVMQLIAGENRPPLSKAHEDKHAGIRHLRIDPERIEITAECTTIDGYLEAFKWFDWLKQEMQDQMSHWQDIVPKREFGSLPTLGHIEVRLSGNQQLLNEGQRPQFSLDGKQATKLLSESLYSDAFPCIRELLQNAVDATLLKLWLLNQKKYPADSNIWKNPFTDEVQDILKTGDVTALLEETEPDADTPSGKSRWKLTITDQGTGISRDDLGYMLRIGSSQANAPRQQKINTMPEWMKPSGAFGIGFQSVFLLSDKVKLITKSVFTNETLDVIMHSPLGEKEGLVEFKLLDNDITMSFGTTVEVVIFLERLPKSYKYNRYDEYSIKSQIISSFDPVLDDTLPLEAADLAEKIREFATNSLVWVCRDMNAIYKPMKPMKPIGLLCDFNDNSDKYSKITRQKSFYIVKEHQLELVADLNLSGVFSSSFAGSETLYRGQPFEQKCLNDLPIASIKINLLSGKAGKWLTANRERLSDSAVKEFRDIVLAALEQLAAEYINQIKEESKPAYSFFLERMAMQYEHNWIELAKKLDRDWLKLNAPNPVTTDKISFEYLFGKENWTMCNLPLPDLQILLPPISGDFQIDDSYGAYTKEIIIKEWMKTAGNTIQIIESKEYENSDLTLIYQFAKKPQPLYSPKALAIKLISVDRRKNNRFVLNDLDNRWETLYLKENSKINAFYLFGIPSNKNIVLLPFLFYRRLNMQSPAQITATPSQLEALCQWIQPYLEKSSATLEEIRTAYNELIRYIDYDIMKPSPHWEAWKKDRMIDAH
ncbi:HD domain-containing protein [Methylovulum psychrotolerans]|uniref:HD-CE domain-containing protein n=1 Tax=Methylovulum psychrotolerans TaxID=1704499 RepID=A0A1Z4BUI8_9GAMM|nr:ATP-binding protein [Methylovulum psychrotolerans]ASF44892.1 hypothetical protein CEK71_01765 [Methylovulum psychrotolerans]